MYIFLFKYIREIRFFSGFSRLINIVILYLHSSNFVVARGMVKRFNPDGNLKFVQAESKVY